MPERRPLSEVPIIQAPMAGGPSTPELTAAVAAAGGYGFLAAGYRSPDGLRQLITATRSITDAPFGVNLFFPSSPSELGPVWEYAEAIQAEADRLGVALGEPRWEDDAYASKVEIVEEARIDTVSFTFGCPDPSTVDRLHRVDCQVAVTVTSVAEARVAERTGADLLVVQGTEAGGHQGSFLDLAPNSRPLLSLLEQVRESTQVPLVGSGGIMTGAGARAARERGAIGVQLGTAFLCAEEAGTSVPYRRALMDQTYRDTVLTRAFSGRYARGLGQRVLSPVRRARSERLSGGPSPDPAAPGRGDRGG